MILAYHEFSSTPLRDVYCVTRDTFERHTSIASRAGGHSQCVTFDDAHHSQFTIALPLLEEHRLSGIFFVPTAWVGCRSDVMSWRELRQLNEMGHTIGSHTHTHPMLTSCGDRALQSELTVSKQLLEDLLGNEVRTISIPSGRVNRRVLSACKEAGYRRVYTSQVGEYAAASQEYPEVIGRFVVRRATTEHTLADYMAGHVATCRRLSLASTGKTIAKRLIGDSLYQRLWRYAVRSDLYNR